MRYCPKRVRVWSKTSTEYYPISADHGTLTVNPDRISTRIIPSRIPWQIQKNKSRFR